MLPKGGTLQFSHRWELVRKGFIKIILLERACEEGHGPSTEEEDFLG